MVINTPLNPNTTTESMSMMHPLEAAIRRSDTKNIERMQDVPDNETAVMIKQNGCKIMAQWFKQLATSGRPTNNETLTACLETICSKSVGRYYLNTFFFDMWREKGWAKAKKKIYVPLTRGQKAINRPSI